MDFYLSLYPVVIAYMVTNDAVYRDADYGGFKRHTKNTD